MKVISFQRKDGSAGIGVMAGETQFVDVARHDSGIPASLRALLQTTDGLQRLRKAAQGQPADLSFDQVSLLPVIRDKIPGLVRMKPGDVVEVEVDDLGVLKNPIIADGPVAYRPA